jgi:hypothetical protein
LQLADILFTLLKKYRDTKAIHGMLSSTDFAIKNTALWLRELNLPQIYAYSAG